MQSEPIIFFAGGGTGGHLYPGISVAQAILKEIPDAKPVFLCTTREIDRVILDPTGFEFVPQPIVPPVRTIAGLLKFWRKWRETKDLVRKIIRERRPAAVLGLGGYAAGVAVKSASHRKIPTAILNPDVIPGKANQYLMRDVNAVCCQFEESAQYVSQNQRGKLKTTGCPVRQDILTPPARDLAIKALELDPIQNTLVVTGASQGAQTVNEAVIETLKTLKVQGWQILHLAGREHAEAVRKGYREIDVAARVIDFTPEMSQVWAVADLAICRSGASTCAELTVRGVPSVLFPYPFHKDMHQRANAKVLADAGAAVLLDDARERKENAARLKPVLEKLLHDSATRQSMGAAAKQIGRPDASKAVADVLRSLIG